MKHFPGLIEMILLNTDSENAILKLHQIFFQCIHHHRLMSFTVRIEDFDLSMLNKMKEEARVLFKSCCLFSQNVSPSMWTLCNAVPYHAEVTFNEYNQGLGCNTMEGRENH